MRHVLGTCLSTRGANKKVNTVLLSGRPKRNHTVIIMVVQCCAVLTDSVVSDSLQPQGLEPPGASVHGILQARTLEWVALPSSRTMAL